MRRELVMIYSAGIALGLALVTFPAASVIFTSPAHFGLSSTQYGAMFLPQALAAIVFSLLGAGLTRRLGAGRLYLAGLAAAVLAMALLVLSQFVAGNHTLAYLVLLVATGCLGIGFGLTVPALNTLVAAFMPQKVDQGVLVLNALLGLGTALAPLLVALFVGLNIWWGLPLSVAVLLGAILLLSLRLPLAARGGSAPAGSPVAGAPPAGKADRTGAARGRGTAGAAGATGKTAAAGTTGGKRGIPALFWIFAAFAVLYGIIETMNGNWASLYMRQDLGASTALASLALTVFWGAVTGGRVLFAATARVLSERTVYRLLPILAALAFVALSLLPKDQPVLGLIAFGLAGLGCSALLPLTISFGQAHLGSMAASAAGALIAFYQIGYGIAAFGVGPLQEAAGLALPTLYLASAGVAVALAAVAFVIIRRTKEKSA